VSGLYQREAPVAALDVYPPGVFVAFVIPPQRPDDVADATLESIRAVV
jgi:hypothetical protein